MSKINAYGLSSKDYAKLYNLFYPGDLRDLRPHIIQLTLDGKVIAEYERITQAERKSGVLVDDIRKVCKGNRKTAGGYRWEFKEAST